jgi:hypothetical protein
MVPTVASKVDSHATARSIANAAIVVSVSAHAMNTGTTARSLLR